MEKPVSILINETKSNLIKVCNESHLHLSVLQMIVKELHGEIDKAAKKCMEDELAEYQEAMSQTNEEVVE